MTPQSAERPHVPHDSVLNHLPKPNRLRGATLAAAAVASGALAAAPAVATAHPVARAAPATAVPLLVLGSEGPRVSQVQRALDQRVTGRYNRATKRAVVRFQHRRGLLADGIVGRYTWGALFGVRVTTPAAPAAPAAPTYRAPVRTSVAPVVQRAPTVNRSSGAASGTGGGYSVPSSIVNCESGGNYSAYNASSGAGGAYQIIPSTWRAYGGSGSAHTASRAEQDRVAAKIWNGGAGRSQWSC